MATIVSDDFTRANSSSLGTATTGQVWDEVAGNWSIDTNSALVTWDNGDPGTSIAVVESGFESAITSITLPSVDVPNFAAGIGVICRYVDANYYWRLLTYDFPGNPGQLRLQRVYAGSVTTAIDVGPSATANGDTIAVACCGTDFEIFVNGISQGTYDDSLNPQNYGTKNGLVSISGTTFFLYTLHLDDFLVQTNGTCTPTYNCTGAGCVDPGTGLGTYATLAACLTGCAVAESYNCVDGTCTDPGDGSGDFATLLECQSSGCGIVSTGGISTTRFDEGIGNSYFVVPQLTDSDVELRAKVVKAVRVTGKLTDADAKIYTYAPEQVVDVGDLEAGTNSVTGAIALPDVSLVTTSERVQLNCPNANLHTIRLAGTWDGTEGDAKDRIDEISTEQAIQGARL